MVIAQGDIHWVDFGVPIGSAPGYVRPVVVVQCDDINMSSIATVVVVSITGQLRMLAATGNVRLTIRETGLDRDSVANVSQISTIDKQQIGERIGSVPKSKLAKILGGIDVVLGR
jgi:mRNA interferase MazF